MRREMAFGGLLLAALNFGGAQNLEAKVLCKDALSAKAAFEADQRDKRLFRAYTDFYRRHFHAPTIRELSELTTESLRKVSEWMKIQKNLLKRFEEEKPQVWESIRQAIAKEYLVVSLQRNQTPSESEMIQALNLKAEQYGALFGKDGFFKSLDELKSLARERAPVKFNLVKDADLFDQNYDAETLKLVKDASVLYVTSVIAGFPINEVALKTLIKMAESRNGVVLIRAINGEFGALHDSALQHPRVRLLSSDSLLLTPTWNLSNLSIMAKQKDPLEGVESLGLERDQNLVITAPRYRLKVLPSLMNRYGSVQRVTTGTISNSNYQGDLVISKRRAKLASAEDVLGHFMGALVLEKTSGDNRLVKGTKTVEYHARFIEFRRQFGGFFDVNKFYTPKGAVEMRPHVLVLGDAHVPVTDPHLLAKLEDLIRTVRPYALRLDDVFDGESINPHERDKIGNAARKAAKGKTNLRLELSKVVAFINALHAIDPDLIIRIPPTNHDNFLRRYLEEGQFVKDPENAHLGAELFMVMSHPSAPMDPLKYAIMNGNKPFMTRDTKTQFTHRDTLLDAGLNHPDKVIFLEPGDSWQVGPTDPELRKYRVELGLHGHAGANGSKGLPIKRMAISFGRAVKGHTHTAEAWNGAVSVGTSTPKRLPYNGDSFNNWTQTLALVSPYGQIQLLEFKDGEWMNLSGRPAEGIELEFPTDYPRFQPDEWDGTDDADVDQYSSYKYRNSGGKKPKQEKGVNH